MTVSSGYCNEMVTKEGLLWTHGHWKYAYREKRPRFFSSCFSFICALLDNDKLKAIQEISMSPTFVNITYITAHVRCMGHLTFLFIYN